MDHKNKKTLWVLLGLVVLVIIVWAIMMSKDTEPVADMGGTPSPTPAATTPSTSTAAYNAALLKYGSNRIQFQEGCQTVPNAMVLKTGTAIMLDNRASVSHTIKLDRTYVIPAFGFTIATVSGTPLPHKILVDCDKSQNVTTITVQK